ncbi:hypothetical protein MQE36_07775 [Zhouia spongiae]|uniref:Uncharacterized protein n=1 Tax=Zhouia spongiae TaxID=2202721 RepID=A0ABY3YQT4_9FLAO|nr:hypothetical protein [Zhouia spongiae]UNZ00231.1 hypothetical protein MQE36_07775 [Zhouia spongiae]
MEQIKILCYALTTFFGIENGRIVAEKTEIVIHPEQQQIEINQEGIFTIIQSESDSILALEQWEKMYHWTENDTKFVKELDNLPVKNFTITAVKTDFRPHLTFSYTNKEDLRVFGIWYQEDKDQFSINHIPQQNIKTKNGKLEGNYWFFDGKKSFSFTVEPFLQMPESYKKIKYPITELLTGRKKE